MTDASRTKEHEGTFTGEKNECNAIVNLMMMMESRGVFLCAIGSSRSAWETGSFLRWEPLTFVRPQSTVNYRFIAIFQLIDVFLIFEESIESFGSLINWRKTFKVDLNLNDHYQSWDRWKFIHSIKKNYHNHF